VLEKVVVPKVDIPNYGSFAWFADPDGNTIGLWKPAEAQCCSLKGTAFTAFRLAFGLGTWRTASGPTSANGPFDDS